MGRLAAEVAVPTRCIGETEDGKPDQYLPECDVIVSDWRDKSGSSLAEKVKMDIARSDLVAVLLTDTASSSPWVQQEIGFALGVGKKVVPIVQGPNVPELALLAGVEWEPYEPNAVDTSALRAALRIARCLQEDLTRVFSCCYDYYEWWVTVLEDRITSEKCYWATPHDTWSWIMTHVDSRDVDYRTLIRGGYEFDKLTVETHYQGKEVAFGVEPLAGFEEIAVIGSLSVETVWDPRACREIDEVVKRTPSADAIFRSYRDFSWQPTSIEVRMYLDAERAARHRRRLDSLFDQYQTQKST
ncbi:MAG: hypothetical protein NTY19_47230 [Planctomycetota bacterium]|nr:hypothetical protein [Planctomycetota bacterium]